MRKTWYRRTSDGTFFRNCPLIMAEMDRAKAPWTFNRLDEEWQQCFHQGTIKVTEISSRDRWVEFDDSPEATEAWKVEFLKRRL